MVKTTTKIGIELFASLTLSACATQETSEPLAESDNPCAPAETLACDQFADENYNCTCEKSDNLRDMLDAYSTPDY